MRHKLSGIVLLLTLLATPSAMQAQKDRFDKKNADEFVYERLSKNTGGEDFCKKLILNKQNLADTNEERIKLLPGKSFQINSLRSDVFIDAKTWKPVFDHSYPMESAVNLLMNLAGNCNVTLTQHQYGNVKKTLTMPLHSVFFVLTNEMDTYCNVTQIDKDLIKADLVMHNPKQNIIHLFVVSIPTSELFKNGGNIKAELYANIPQNDIKNIYSKKRK